MIAAGCYLTALLFVLPAEAQTLDEDLRRSPPAELVALAQRDGDAARGGVVFFQHQMACSKCHSVDDARPSTLGPDLAKLGNEVTDELLVAAVLLPSKVIRKGYESVTVVTNDGRSLTGLLVEQTKEKLVLREITRGGELTVPGSAHNIAYKGIAVRLDPGAGGVSRGRHWMIFDTDTLRLAAAWSRFGKAENFIEWRGIQFNGEHQIHPRTVGPIAFANSTGPGTTLALDIDDLRPTWCMEIKYELRSADGKPVVGVIHNTVHELAD